MKRKALSILLVAAFCTLSCRHNVNDGVEMLPFVSLTVSDTTSAGHTAVASYDDADRYGTIAVAGPMEKASALVGFLMECDMFDNVDGKCRPDGLPDFAGETFAPYYDIASLSYYEYYRKGEEEKLRELSVRYAIASVSPNCHLSAYGREASAPKTPSKLFVLASSFAADSQDDIDLLFSTMGKKLPVVSPVASLVSTALADYGPDAKIGLWAGSDVLASGVYASAFDKLSKNRSEAKADYVGFSPSDSLSVEESLFRFLDMYMSSGDGTALSVILTDDFLLPADLKILNGVLERIKISNDPEMLRYRPAIADNCKVCGAMEAVATAIYKYLREHNEFTHRIAYPQKNEYAIVQSSEREGGIKYVEMNNLYVP